MSDTLTARWMTLDEMIEESRGDGDEARALRVWLDLTE